MPTLTEALEDATTALNNAVAQVLGLAEDLEASQNQNVTNVTNVINNFLARPPSQALFVDPILGDDTKDGKSIANCFKTLEKALESTEGSVTSIILFGDYQMRRRVSVFTAVTINGAIRAGNDVGYTFTQRQVTALPEADNSPVLGYGRVSAGVFVFAPYLATSFIDWQVPNVPVVSPPIVVNSILYVNGASTISLDGTTITAVASGGAGSLIARASSRISVMIVGTLGSNAAGRIFNGIASGANPNADPHIITNLTAA